MSASADWYFGQADLFRGRADACRQLAERLDGAALFTVHQDSGETTWRGPVAIEFDEQLAVHRRRLRDAVDRLRTNACGFDTDADDYERQGAHILDM